MQQKNIEPHKVTKPIQLLAAWLAGLIIVNGTFLGAAVAFDTESSERLWLTIASIVNVPLFLGAIFLLQTKFRPELQEDSYYSTYLDKKTQTLTEVAPIEDIRSSIRSLKQEFHSSLLASQGKEEIERSDDYSDISIALSNRFPGSKDVRSLIRNLGFHDIRMFDPEAGGNKPDRLHITINPDLPFQINLHILEVGAKYNFDSYSYDKPNEINTEDIYIGGYGYGDDKINYPFSDSLKELLANSPSREDVEDFEFEYESS